MSDLSFFTELKQLITDYFEARVALLKINVYEKIARVTAVLFSSIIIALVVFFLVFFLSISGGFYLGSLFKSNALGFLIIFGIYFILFVLLLVYRNKVLKKYILDKVIESLFEKEAENE